MDGETNPNFFPSLLTTSMFPRPPFPPLITRLIALLYSITEYPL